MSSQNKKNPTGQATASGYRDLISDLIDEVPGGFAVIAPDSGILYTNRSASRHIRDAKNLTAALHPDDRQGFEFALTRLRLDPSHGQRAEMRLVRADGTDVWMLGDLSAARLNAHGGLEEVLVQFTDIDRQKRTEAEMQSWAQRWNHALVSSTLGVWTITMRPAISIIPRRGRRCAAMPRMP